jgi:hypothetical protein
MHALQVADRWLNVRLELLGNTVVLLSALLSVRAATQGRLVAGLAGLAITNALSVTGLLNWAVRCYAETETMMNSVEVTVKSVTVAILTAVIVTAKVLHCRFGLM